MSKWDLTGFYPGIYIRNQLPVIKPPASAAKCDMIGYFCEIATFEPFSFVAT